MVTQAWEGDLDGSRAGAHSQQLCLIGVNWRKRRKEAILILKHGAKREISMSLF
jgi:hypothetical protein